MRRDLFDALRPVCPQCRQSFEQDHPLRLAHVIRENDHGVIEGILHCCNPACQLEYPIIDGIPIIVPDIRNYIAQSLNHITARKDLSGTIDSILGDCAGPGTHFNVDRQHLSSYAWDHYGDLGAVSETPGEPEQVVAGSIVSCLHRGLELVEPLEDQAMIDLGCSVGRTTFELAEKYKQATLGIDMNFSMLRLAQSILRGEGCSFPLRRMGLVYDPFTPDTHFKHSKLVDFWACDATALPFADGTFGFASALNILDSVQSPYQLLTSMERSLCPSGTAVLACPYDWSPAATPMEGWIGGHSQRSDTHGAPEPFLHALLTPNAHTMSLSELQWVAEIENLEWSVRVHDRSRTVYSVHVVGARKRSMPTPAGHSA